MRPLIAIWKGPKGSVFTLQPPNPEAMFQELKPSDVFTPGKLPIGHRNVYANRGVAEKAFNKSLERSLVPVVFGEFGVGKTSLAMHTVKSHQANGTLVHVESVAGKGMRDVFQQCLERLGYTITSKEVRTDLEGSTTSTTSGAGFEIGGFSVTTGSGQEFTFSASKQSERELVVSTPTDSRIIDVCEKAGIALIIDEMHRASEEFRNELALFIKAYGNANCSAFKVMVLGTSSDAMSLVRLDPGIDRLLQEIRLGSMSDDEARYVVTTGMTSLKISIEEEEIDAIVKTSVGSPSILQYMCLEVAELAFERDGKSVMKSDPSAALNNYVSQRGARLNEQYKKAIETFGDRRYRMRVLHAMAEDDGEYVTLEEIRKRVSAALGTEVKSSTLSGPLRSLKKAEYGSILKDTDRLDGLGRSYNITVFTDPSMKAFVRMMANRDRK